MASRAALPHALTLALSLVACARPVDGPPAPATKTVAAASSATAPQPSPTPSQLAGPRTYHMSLLYMSGSTPTEFVLVLDGSLGFKTVDAMEQFLDGQPEGTVLDWDPGCLRHGNEPLLSDPKAMEAFQRFCAAHHFKFVLHPSG